MLLAQWMRAVYLGVQLAAPMPVPSVDAAAETPMAPTPSVGPSRGPHAGAVSLGVQLAAPRPVPSVNVVHVADAVAETPMAQLKNDQPLLGGGGVCNSSRSRNSGHATTVGGRYARRVHCDCSSTLVRH